ncbi:MAG: ATP-binding cassette domain-containing protein [Desulfobacterales bacterium]|nr:ATP-binding cassette domain-containing protein [Desulfobacterales bacterium]
MTLELINMCVFNQGGALFDPIDLTIDPGEIATIMGSSGCGKSTLLSAVAGSLDPVFSLSGTILLHSKEMIRLPMEKRNIGILFQDDLLFPNMSIGANLSFALAASIPAQKRRVMVGEALDKAGLSGYENRDPASLSGGQKARVSLVRSLLAQPAALLLDEPFSKLDQTLKQRIRTFVFSQIRQMRIPALLVTHDPSDCPVNGKIINLVRKEG